MYTPAHHRVEDRAAILDFMRAHPFVALVTHGEAGLRATHAPIVTEEHGERVTLFAHIAKANPQRRDLDGGAEVMVIFAEPHAYVSPRHYEQPESVPTWNYAAVHAYGAPRIIEDPGEKREMQLRLIAGYDQEYLTRFPELPRGYVDAKLAAIVSLAIDVVRLEARFKLSQEKLPVERERIIRSLEASGVAASVETARLMRLHSR